MALAFLAGGELGRDVGRMIIMGSTFNQHPASMRMKRSFIDRAKRSPKGEDRRNRRSESIAGLRDGALAAALASGVFSGDHAKVTHHLARMGKARKIA